MPLAGRVRCVSADDAIRGFGLRSGERPCRSLMENFVLRRSLKTGHILWPL